MPLKVTYDKERAFYTLTDTFGNTVKIPLMRIGNFFARGNNGRRLSQHFQLVWKGAGNVEDVLYVGKDEIEAVEQQLHDLRPIGFSPPPAAD